MSTSINYEFDVYKLADCATAGEGIEGKTGEGHEKYLLPEAGLLSEKVRLPPQSLHLAAANPRDPLL